MNTYSQGYITWLHARPWEEWFAWHPVKAGGKYYWMTKVYRLMFYNGYAYRKYDGVPVYNPPEPPCLKAYREALEVYVSNRSAL